MESISREHYLIGVCTPLGGLGVCKEWAIYLTKLQSKYPTAHYFINHPNLPTARNDLVDLAIGAGCTHILWLDSDIEMVPNGIDILVEHDKDVVGFVAFWKNPPFNPNIYKNNKIMTKFPKGLIEVEGIGTGCMMVKTHVYEKIRKSEGYQALRGTFFRFQEDRLNSRTVLGEDLTFCLLARQAGFKIWADTANPCVHWGSYPFGINDYLACRKKPAKKK